MFLSSEIQRVPSPIQISLRPSIFSSLRVSFGYRVNGCELTANYPLRGQSVVITVTYVLPNTARGDAKVPLVSEQLFLRYPGVKASFGFILFLFSLHSKSTQSNKFIGVCFVVVLNFAPCWRLSKLQLL